jgi:hypothetical protein
MTQERRLDDERWTRIEVSIGKIETHMERSEPALKQVWTNKTSIERMKLIQSIIIWIGGVTGTGFIITLIKNIVTKYPPPPHIPH